MHLQSRFKDWRRRRLLARAGIGVELARPWFAAGARSGVWVVDPTGLGRDSTVYSFGTGDNIAWDLAMIERFGCDVHAFDPTPRAIAWLAAQALPPQFHFAALGIGARDGEQAFAVPKDANGVNYRPIAVLRGAAAGAIQAPVRRLATLCRERGHDRVDVLKLDIEGGEYDVLLDVVGHGPPVAQILVEFHHGQHGIPFSATTSAIAVLRAHGYRVLHVSRRGLEFTFVRS
jgi:FkbM family methyltransferase